MKIEGMMLGHPEYEEMIDTFMPSEDMRKLLKTAECSPLTLKQMVLGSPVPLKVKSEWLKKSCESLKASPEQDDWLLSDFKDAIEDIDAALAHLHTVSKSEILSLDECWYDYDIREHKSYTDYLFGNFEAARTYIQKEESGEDYTVGGDGKYKDEDGHDLPLWWTLTKWMPDGGKKQLKRKYTYYRLHDEPVWFQKEFDAGAAAKDQRFHGRREYLDSSCLELPVPYTAGDIIAIDTYPFGSCEPGVVICKSEPQDEYLCCLMKGENGGWGEGNITHGLLQRNICQNDFISVFYNIRKWPDKPEGEYSLLAEVSKAIYGDNQAGDKLWEAIYTKETLTDAELLEILKQL